MGFDVMLHAITYVEAGQLRALHSPWEYASVVLIVVIIGVIALLLNRRR